MKLIQHLVVRALVAGLLLAGAFGARPARAAGEVTDCTETGLANAMLADGLITFNCGPNPVVISMTLQNGGLNVFNGHYNTIDGGDKVTLSGANAQRLFDVRVNGALTLTHIILTNGFAATLGNLPDWGGAVLDEGNRLVLDHVTIRNSHSLHLGGAIRVVTGTAVIQDSLLENNDSGWGGAIDGLGALSLVNTIVRGNRALTDGGGGLSLGGQTIIENSQIYSNTANGAAGGGGLYLTAPSVVAITDTQIYSNVAPDSSSNGGGIENFGALTVNHSSLSANYADIGGGLANESGASATLDQARFSNNSATELGGGLFNQATLAMTDTTLSGNRVDGDGGGLDNYGGSATLVNSTFVGNRASAGAGIDSAALLTLTNDTISGNKATGDGGGLANLGGAVMALTNVTFSGNSAPEGGAITFVAFSLADSLTLTSTLVANSPAGGNCYVFPFTVKGITSAGFNLSDDGSCALYFNLGGDQNNRPALLFPLANNGGPTLTHLPRHDSPAIDNGAGLGCPAGDQRGQPRPSGGICDIGAVEAQPTDLTWPSFLPAVRR